MPCMRMQTYAPCVTLALMVQQAPRWDDLSPLFHRLAPPLLEQVLGRGWRGV
jgi:hypothetical protein